MRAAHRGGSASSRGKSRAAVTGATRDQRPRERRARGRRPTADSTSALGDQLAREARRRSRRSPPAPSSSRCRATPRARNRFADVRAGDQQHAHHAGRRAPAGPGGRVAVISSTMPRTWTTGGPPTPKSRFGGHRPDRRARRRGALRLRPAPASRPGAAARARTCTLTSARAGRRRRRAPATQSRAASTSARRRSETRSPAARTPMIVVRLAVDRRRRVRRSTDRLLKRSRQPRSLSTATAALPAAPRRARKKRPSAGVSPSIGEQRRRDAAPPSSRDDSPSRVTV